MRRSGGSKKLNYAPDLERDKDVRNFENMKHEYWTKPTVRYSISGKYFHSIMDLHWQMSIRKLEERMKNWPNIDYNRNSKRGNMKWTIFKSC